MYPTHRMPTRRLLSRYLQRCGVVLVQYVRRRHLQRRQRLVVHNLPRRHHQQRRQNELQW